jgi:hypothetical protein
MRLAPLTDRLALAFGASAAGLTLTPAFENRAEAATAVVLTAVVVAGLLPRGWWALPAVLTGPVVTLLLSGQPVPPGELTRPAGWVRLGEMLAAAPGRALHVTLPLPGDLLVVPALLAGVAAAGGAVLTRRRPGGLEALAPAVAVGIYGLVAAGLAATQTLPAGLGLAAAGLLLVGARRTGHPVGPALLVLALAAAPLLLAEERPAADAADPRDRFRTTTRVSSSVDVLDQVGGWISAPAGEVLFTAAGPGAVKRWRLAVLDSYDGRTWQSAGRLVPAGLGVPPHRGPAPAAAVTQTIELAALRGVYLPAADRPIRIGPPVDALDPDTGVLLTSRAVRTGDRYQVTSLPGAIAPASTATSAASSVVPPDLRPALEAFLDSVPMRSSRPPAEQAEAVRLALRQTRRNLTGAPSSATAAAIERLLRPGGTGTTVQFASAYALALRVLGVPARLVVGFAGGATVHSRDVRVWTELRLPGTGWVTYDPTPPPSRADTVRQQNEPPPLSTELPPPTGDDRPPPPPPPPPGRGVPWSLLGLVVLALGAGLLALRASVPIVRRAWRRYRPAGPAARVVGAWLDVLETCAPPDQVNRAALTPGLLHDLIAARLSDAEPAGRTLSRLADRALYSPRPCTVDDARLAWRSARQVRRALRGGRRPGAVPWPATVSSPGAPSRR